MVPARKEIQPLTRRSVKVTILSFLIALPFCYILILFVPVVVPFMVENRICPAHTHIQIQWHPLSFTKLNEPLFVVNCLSTQGISVPKIPGSEKLSWLDLFQVYGLSVLIVDSILQLIVILRNVRKY